MFGDAVFNEAVTLVEAGALDKVDVVFDEAYFATSALIAAKSNDVFIKKFSKVTISGLLLTLVLIFSLQTELILSEPLHIVLIAVPLVIQTFLIFFIAYGASKLLKLPHDVAAPAGMIGASNFFELAVAVAIALFPLNPGVALATIVGVLVEVPVMLILVKIANRTKHLFQ